MEPTSRERIAERLRAEPATAADLSTVLSLPTPVVYEHLEHVSRSIEEDEEFLVAPPECRDCGFDRFDDPVNSPSRCPECKSESVEEPAFLVE